MKAFAIDELGHAGSVHELEVPEPAPGEVRVRVAAAGLNPFDSAVVNGYLKGRMEHRFPLVPGIDASGTVDAVGDGVEEWAPSEDVFGSVGKSHLGAGTLAEFATMSAGTVARRPASLDHASAAAVPVAAVTALIMADALALGDGRTVVVLGATGGVGSFFVQLAARRGARVLGVGRGENADVARRLGAADVIDYTTGDVVEAVRSRYPDGIDALADMHGDREGVAGLADLVRAGGRVASAVGAADVDALAGRGIEATNVYGAVTTTLLDTLAGMVAAGEIVVPELHTFTLALAGDALAAVGTGHVRGKVVVTVD